MGIFGGDSWHGFFESLDGRPGFVTYNGINGRLEHIHLEPQGQPFINGCFNWMIPNLYVENDWKSPNIHL